MATYRRDTKFIKQFASNLKRIRLKIGMSQEELAYKSDLNLSTVGRIERGETNVGLTMIKLLADNLGVSVKELFEF